MFKTQKRIRFDNIKEDELPDYELLKEIFILYNDVQEFAIMHSSTKHINMLKYISMHSEDRGILTAVIENHNTTTEMLWTFVKSDKWSEDFYERARANVAGYAIWHPNATSEMIEFMLLSSDFDHLVTSNLLDEAYTDKITPQIIELIYEKNEDKHTIVEEILQHPKCTQEIKEHVRVKEILSL